MIEQMDKMIVRPTQAETAYALVSPTAGMACANCRWFVSPQSGGPACHIIDNYPLDILETGSCSRHEMLPSMPMPESMEMSEPMEEAEREHEHPESIYIAPDSNDSNVFKALMERFKRGLKPGQTVLHGTDGARYMLVVTSNSYEDRERETITTHALKAYVENAWKADDLFASSNPLLFWHDDRLKAGDIVWAKMSGPFLVELAKEASNPIAQLMFDYREANPDEKWGASHRFGYYAKDRDPDGTYHRIFKQETSMLPREAAANLLTFSGVIPVTDKKNEYLNKMLGLDNAAELLDQGIDKLVAALEAKGIAHKSTDSEPAAEPTLNEAGKQFGTLLVQLVQDVAAQEERIDTAEKMYTEKAAALDSERQQSAETVKALVEQVEALKAQLDARPRSASRASETTIENGSLPDHFKNLDTETHPVWGAVKPKS